MNDLYLWSMVAVIALVTTSLRYLPFIIFGRGHRVPKVIDKLGKMLPYSIMGILVVYCLKNVGFENLEDYLPEVIACLIVGVLYVWKRNTLLSIVMGTISYMVLVQMVF